MNPIIYRTDRTDEHYNISFQRFEDDRVRIDIGQDAKGMGVVLTKSETEAFFTSMAALIAAKGIPPHEPSSCGTAYLASERALRIIEHATTLGEAMSADAIEAITNLAHEAGAACNRLALRRQAFADEIPF